MSEQGTRRAGLSLVLVPARNAEAPRILAPTEVRGILATRPVRHALGIVATAPAPAEERLAALGALAGLAQDGLLATPGAREALLGLPGLRFSYAGMHRPAEGPETDAWWLDDGPPADAAVPVKRPLPRAFSIAVLPFRAPRGPADLLDLARGLSDDLAAGLCRFRGLDVAARGTTWPWRSSGLPPAEIGQRLGVAHVVDGLLRQAGDRLRLDVAVVEVETGRALWAERYFRAPGDLAGLVSDVEDRVSAAVARTLQGSARPLPALRDGRAYDLVIRGEALLLRLTEASLREARALAEAAADLDPRNARALALRSRCENVAWRYGWTEDPDRALGTALDFALRAAEADPLDARARGEIGFARLYRKEHAASLAAYEAALRLNPNDPDLLADIADAWSHMGRAEAAIPLMDRAMTLNPYFPDLYLWQLGGALFCLRRYGEAVRAILRMQDRTEGRRVLAAAWALMGERAKAEAEAEAILRAHPRFTVAGWAAVVPDLDPSETAHFAGGLRAAGLP